MEFLVCRTQKLIDRHLFTIENYPTKQNNLIPKKVNIFIWRVGLHGILTKDNLLATCVIFLPLCVRFVIIIQRRWIIFFWSIRWLRLKSQVIRFRDDVILTWSSLSIVRDLHAWVDLSSLSWTRKLVLGAFISMTWWSIWKFGNQNCISY